MIRCQSCGELSERNERTFPRVLETRSATYTNDGVVSYGSEIVKEIRVCMPCYTGVPREPKPSFLEGDSVA